MCVWLFVVGSHPTVLRTYSWLYTEGPLLIGFSYRVLGIDPQVGEREVPYSLYC